MTYSGAKFKSSDLSTHSADSLFFRAASAKAQTKSPYSKNNKHEENNAKNKKKHKEKQDKEKTEKSTTKTNKQNGYYYYKIINLTFTTPPKHY